MPKNGTQYRVFRYRLNVMSALENSPNSSDATHALGVNVRKSGILWPTIVYQARFNRTRLAIDIELLPDILLRKKAYGVIQTTASPISANITALQPRSKRQVTSSLSKFGDGRPHFAFQWQYIFNKFNCQLTV